MQSCDRPDEQITIVTAAHPLVISTPIPREGTANELRRRPFWERVCRRRRRRWCTFSSSQSGYPPNTYTSGAAGGAQPPPPPHQAISSSPSYDSADGRALHPQPAHHAKTMAVASSLVSGSGTSPSVRRGHRVLTSLRFHRGRRCLGPGRHATALPTCGRSVRPGSTSRCPGTARAGKVPILLQRVRGPCSHRPRTLPDPEQRCLVIIWGGLQGGDCRRRGTRALILLLSYP